MDNSDASTFYSRASSFFDSNVKSPRNPILFTETERRSPDLLRKKLTEMFTVTQSKAEDLSCPRPDLSYPKPRRSSLCKKLSQLFEESNKENVDGEDFKIPKKRGRQKKEKSLTQPKPTKKSESKRKPRTKKLLPQTQLPSSTSPGPGLDYTKFQEKMASLPTELEQMQIRRKPEIEHFKKVWLNHNAGLKEINKEKGIENESVDSDFEFIHCPTEIKKMEESTSQKLNHFSADIFEDCFYDLPILSPAPPSVAPTIKRHIKDIEEFMISDHFVFGIDDLVALSNYLRVDFNKLLKAATILRSNGILKPEEDDDGEYIPCSQSPRRRGEFWRERISQTQCFIGK